MYYKYTVGYSIYGTHWCPDQRGGATAACKNWSFTNIAG